MADRSSSRSPGESNPAEISTRLAATIERVHERIENRDVESLEEERIQIKWVRTFGTLVGQYRKLQKEIETEESSESTTLADAIEDVLEDRDDEGRQ